MGHEPGTTFEVGESLMLGRATTADITVQDSFASSTHAHVYLRGGHVYVEDAGSTNGTYLNGRPLRRPERLSVADTVRIGETEYRYQE
jgi:pSer/pThr/pTyr-binding forkhead associated (FHA) protein